MTNFEKLKSKSLNDFAVWLDENGLFDDSPWMNWFAETYCNKCESVKCDYKDVAQLYGWDAYPSNRKVECAYCEVHGKCKFFDEINDIPNNLDMIKMWLELEEASDADM